MGIPNIKKLIEKEMKSKKTSTEQKAYQEWCNDVKVGYAFVNPMWSNSDQSVVGVAAHKLKGMKENETAKLRESSLLKTDEKTPVHQKTCCYGEEATPPSEIPYVCFDETDSKAAKTQENRKTGDFNKSEPKAGAAFTIGIVFSVICLFFNFIFGSIALHLSLSAKGRVSSGRLGLSFFFSCVGIVTGAVGYTFLVLYWFYPNVLQTMFW